MAAGSVSTPAALSGGTALGLAPAAITPGISWVAKWISGGSLPLPTEPEATSIAVVILFIGGGVVWTVVTLVRWAFRKHHIIEEGGNGQVVNP